jgi:hypothetical protein
VGVSIHYRGSLADLDRVEDFEDRVIDLVLAIGGNVRLWRSTDKRDRSRMVRGLIVDLAPGQEPTSLLLSPEGWLVHLIEIEDAEKGVLSEPPWCSVKTQFGPIEGHVALAELLAALKTEFMPNLEVNDEGGYWEHRDLGELRQKTEFVGKTIDALADALASDGLSAEAAEDPNILATRIERLARKVHATISRPAEHPPVRFPSDETGAPPDPIENEALWDALHQENRRKQERMQRVMEERMAQGDDTRTALDAAIEEVVPQFEWDDEDEDVDDDFIAELNQICAVAADEPDEPWLESIPEAVRNDDDDSFSAMEQHPLMRQATELLTSFYDAAERLENRSPSVDLLMRSAGEINGGLAQALPPPRADNTDDNRTGLCLVQLKRALRGAAFVRGALFLLRSDKLLGEEEFRRFIDESEAISAQIVDLLRTIRQARD